MRHGVDQGRLARTRASGQEERPPQVQGGIDRLSDGVVGILIVDAKPLASIHLRPPIGVPKLGIRWIGLSSDTAERSPDWWCRQVLQAVVWRCLITLEYFPVRHDSSF